MGGQGRISERSEKARKLGRIAHASGGHEPWAWMETDFGPKGFDDTAECWREEAGRAWAAESPAGQAWLVVGALVCAMLTVGWVGWVVRMVCSKG